MEEALFYLVYNKKLDLKIVYSNKIKLCLQEVNCIDNL